MEEIDPSSLYCDGCVPDVLLVLRDAKGSTLARLRAVRAILSAWSPVLRGALELLSSDSVVGLCASSTAGCGPGSSGCGPGGFMAGSSSSGGASGGGDYGTPGGCSLGGCASSCSGLLELPVHVDSHKELEAWRVALCLMHPLDPLCGRSPSSLITTCAVKSLVMLADKFNLQGLLPHCKDMLLDPRSVFGVPGIHDSYKLDAMEWLQIAEGVPGFEAVVGRCITQIVASTTISRGRSQRVSGALDQPRYSGHEALVSAMAGLRPETCAKLATSMASCLAVACANLANQDRYSIKPVGEHWWGWEYQYEIPLRK